MERGGQVIYAGPLGHQSHKLVEYFEVSVNTNIVVLLIIEHDIKLRGYLAETKRTHL